MNFSVRRLLAYKPCPTRRREYHGIGVGSRRERKKRNDFLDFVRKELEAKLSVEDSPNSAGMTIDAIRCLRLARDRRLRGSLTAVSAWTMKHPPHPISDERARHLVEIFIRQTRQR